MKARLVFDGGDYVDPMCQPLMDQMVGTIYEQLGETACRICYESGGLDKNGKRKGRSSAKLHEHILEVDNTSVYEHINFTVKIYDPKEEVVRACINRKGIWLVQVNPFLYELTLNPRVILHWDKHTRAINKNSALRDTLTYVGHKLCPQIIRAEGSVQYDISIKNHDLDQDQAWISMWLRGSRGFSAEQNRHRNPISQRSTRYVDESESDYIEGPAITQFLNDPSVDWNVRSTLNHLINESTKADKATYDYGVAELEKYYIGKGMEKTPARKNARGTAREYLALALPTEKIYSANVTNWLWMLNQRMSPFADPQIRVIYNDVLKELQRSRYGHWFDLATIPAPDGIGLVLAGG